MREKNFLMKFLNRLWGIYQKIKKYQNCKNDVYQPDEKGYPQTVFSHSICYRVNRKTVVDNTPEKL